MARLLLPDIETNQLNVNSTIRIFLNLLLNKREPIHHGKLSI